MLYWAGILGRKGKSDRAVTFLEKIETGSPVCSGRILFFHWPYCKVNFALSLIAIYLLVILYLYRYC